MIALKGRSPNFGDNVLVWDKQLDLLMNTKDVTFTWQVQNGPKMTFTVQSLVQAFFKGNFEKQYASADGRTFYIVPISELVQI